MKAEDFGATGGAVAARLAPVAMALVLAFAVLGWLDRWLYTNEVFNSLSMGLSYAVGERGLVRLKDAALAYCELHAPAGDLVECRYYQNVITDSLSYAHPLTAFLSLQVRELAGVSDWLPGLQRIAVQAPLLGAAVGLAYWLLLTYRLTPRDRLTTVAITACLFLTARFRDDSSRLIPDPIMDAGGWAAPLALIVVVGLAYVAVSRIPIRAPAYGVDAAKRMASHPGFLMGFAIVLFILSVVLPAAANPFLEPMAFLAILAFLRQAGGEDVQRASPALWASVVGLLFVAATADSLWFMRRLGSAGSIAGLVYLAFIGLATTRPASRLIWLMPVLAIFHLPIAALVGLATACAEGVICLRRQRSSTLLGASVLTFAISFIAITLGIESEAASPDTARPGDVLWVVLGWPGLLPATLTVVTAAALSLWPLAGRDGRDDSIVRCGLLVTQGLAAMLLSRAILDYDPSLLNAPGYALFAKSPGYVAPALLAAAILGLGLALTGQPAPAVPSETSRPSRVRLGTGSVVALLLLLVVAKVDLKPRGEITDAPTNLWRYVIVGDLHPASCRDLWQVRGDDDTYVLSATDPVNAPVIYLSALKLRLRLDAGLYRDEDFRVVPQASNPEACAGER